MIGLRKLLTAVMVTCGLVAVAWPGMDMPVLHVDGRYLKDDAGNVVNLHGFAQTYSPWFNERGTKWNNYDVNGCLEYNKKKIDELLEAGWKMNFVRIHMDPYWSNTPGVSTTGENDISAFDFNRFRTYLSQVFIPMAEYAVSKGLYVVMRPPGVCPEKIEIGDAYHKYLKRVWGYVSTQSRLTDNPHIMFELANEPVQIKDNDGQFGSNTDGCFKNLTAYFQEIVDLMRGNGCDNILWIPGTGYQSQYAGFARYPVTGDNIGYAVHVYPGWYGSDAIEPSHELGGSYGGGFNAFAAGWASQIKPVADFAPVMVTEMDWAPSKYDASWGKSITGKMFGEGFG
ncbi:cellulase family glycosylhydrolase, partial [uncultured Duncaniella sp.]